jgi:hypothetical protein
LLKALLKLTKKLGELKETPVSFRETVYKNDKVELNLYPTGSAGIFDIFISYARN